jgi:hypothetical protein
MEKGASISDCSNRAKVLIDYKVRGKGEKGIVRQFIQDTERIKIV